jgi:6-pyruvoyltetrahydropterin/6-carboxytetrahydropterin synthase
MTTKEYLIGITGAFILGVVVNSLYMDAKKPAIKIPQEAHKMFYLKKSFKFDAAHRLESYKGKCSNMHGHSWKGTLCIQAKNVSPDTNMVIDFSLLKKDLNEMVDELDHKVLNEVLPFKDPTAESLAYYLFCKAKKLIGEKYNVRISSVSIEESEGSEAIYHE